nr:hypothetical protein [Cutibacterium acnes]
MLWHWYCDVSAGCQQTSAVAA